MGIVCFHQPPSVSSQPRSFGASRAHSEPPLMRSSTLAVKNARRCLDRIEVVFKMATKTYKALGNEISTNLSKYEICKVGELGLSRN